MVDFTPAKLEKYREIAKKRDGMYHRNSPTCTHIFTLPQIGAHVLRRTNEVSWAKWNL